MQKAGEPENDAGFLNQLNCSCYSYPFKPRLQWLKFFRLHSYGISKWLLMQLTHEPTHALHVHYSYVLCAYLYCVYALVGGAISIRDPYICAAYQSVPTNRTLSSTGPLSVQ